MSRPSLPSSSRSVPVVRLALVLAFSGLGVCSLTRLMPPVARLQAGSGTKQERVKAPELEGGAAWLNTAGVSAQATAAWRDVAFVTAGLRGERNDGYAAATGIP